MSDENTWGGFYETVEADSGWALEYDRETGTLWLVTLPNERESQDDDQS
jgi:hypothetical protein